MKKTLLAVVLITVCAASANAAYTGSFAKTWSSSDNSLLAAPWVYNGAYPEAGRIRSNDNSFATLDIGALLGLNFNGRGNTLTSRTFVLQAEIYNMASNFAQDCGISIGRTGDNKGVQLGGSNAGN